MEDRIRELEQKAVGWQVEERIEDRIRALEHKAVGWQVIGEKVIEIEGRVERDKQELAELETRLEGALLSSGSMEASLDKMAKSQAEIREAIQSLELEAWSVESEESGSEAEWIRVEGKKQQKVRKQQEQTRVDRVAQKPSETQAEQTAAEEAGGQGREDEADETEARAVGEQTGGQRSKERADRTMAGVAAIPQTQEIVVIGDSIARGVGARLQEQHGVVRVFAKGGGTLTDAQRKVDEIRLNGEEAVIIMTGGNDIDRGDGTEEVVRGYERLVTSLRSKGVERITLVGPSTRRHFSTYFKSKVIGINNRLRRWCTKERVNFVEGGVTEKDKIRLLARDGVHFSRNGEDFMVRKIYQSTRQYLNGLGTTGVKAK